MSVYLIRDTGARALKIGYTTGGALGVSHRLHQLQTGNPSELVLVNALLGAPEEIERELHERHAERHIRGEWFDDHERIVREFELLSGEEWGEDPEPQPTEAAASRVTRSPAADGASALHGLKVKRRRQPVIDALAELDDHLMDGGAYSEEMVPPGVGRHVISLYGELMCPALRDRLVARQAKRDASQALMNAHRLDLAEVLRAEIAGGDYEIHPEQAVAYEQALRSIAPSAPASGSNRAA